MYVFSVHPPPYLEEGRGRVLGEGGMGAIKTTVVLDSRCLAEAMEASGARTKRDAIESGLRLLISEARRKGLRQGLGTYEIDLDVQRLRRQRLGG